MNKKQKNKPSIAFDQNNGHQIIDNRNRITKKQTNCKTQINSRGKVNSLYFRFFSSNQFSPTKKIKKNKPMA